MKKLDVVLSADERYAEHLSVVLVSTLMNCSDPGRIRFTILDGGLHPETADRLSALVEGYGANMVLSSQSQALYQNFPVNAERMSVAAYYRISIAEILPSDVARALYLDCDLVIERDILELVTFSIDHDMAVAAVEDISRTPAYQRLDIPPHHYFNSGVLLLNLPYWRRHSIGEQVRQFKDRFAEKLTTNDQCALNGVLWDRWVRMPLLWNQQSGVYRRRMRRSGITGYSEADFRQAIKSPGIIHYVGARKPWGAVCPHPLRDRYHYYRARTPWPYRRKASMSEYLVRVRKAHHYLKGAYYRRQYVGGAGGRGQSPN
ncbi:glycosyltransferase family 8 protein [Spiribacter insolitus]|uniref:Glycosyltransferase family 8 protein n=1 Tax=Spiribacter insolitus TaxID=3122417 RepID=A0ABV3T810_9GAMM